MSGVAGYKQRHGTAIGDPARGGAESRAPSCAYGLTQWHLTRACTREPSTSQDDPSMRTRKWDPCHYDVTAYPFIRTCSLMKCTSAPPSVLRTTQVTRSAASSRATVLCPPCITRASWWASGGTVLDRAHRFFYRFLNAIESLWIGPRELHPFSPPAHERLLWSLYFFRENYHVPSRLAIMEWPPGPR